MERDNHVIVNEASSCNTHTCSVWPWTVLYCVLHLHIAIVSLDIIYFYKCRKQSVEMAAQLYVLVDGIIPNTNISNIQIKL